MVGGVVFAVCLAVASRREVARLGRVVQEALGLTSRLAVVLGTIEPRAIGEAELIARRAKTASQSGNDETGPARGSEETKATRTSPATPPTPIRQLNDEQLWAWQCKKRGWKDADGEPLDAEDRIDAERLAGEAEGLLEGAKAA